MEDRIKLLGNSQLVDGIELHLPYEVTEDTFDKIRNIAKDFNIKILSVVPGLFNEMEFENGLDTNLKTGLNNGVRTGFL